MNYQEMKKRKEELQITTEQLALASHIPTGIINRLLRGEITSPSPEIMKALEQILFPEHFAPSGTDAAPSHIAAGMIREAMPAYSAASMGPYTLEDYLALPDDVRAELIDGNIIYMEAPTVWHQAFLFKVAFTLESFVQKNKGTCNVFVAPLDVQLDCDDRTMVQPDVVVICPRDKITYKRIYGAPDFCIEVMSPTTRSHDMKTKLRKYKAAGVREYWMVDIGKRQVICYFFERDVAPAISPFETPVPVHIFDCNLTIDFSEIEAGLIR